MAARKKKPATTSTDSSQGAAPLLPPLVQAVADELISLGVNLSDVEAILAIELATELSGFLCKNRAGLTKELRSVMAELRTSMADPEGDDWDEAMRALSEPA